MKNKRGAELPMSTIVVVILVILVLVIVAAAFTGGMKTMFDKIKELFGIYSPTNEEAARLICGNWCSAGSYSQWCNYEFKEFGKSCGGVGATCTTDKNENLPTDCVSKYPKPKTE